MGNQKNPWAVAVMSFFIAGSGQVYNGERWGKGAVYFCMRFIGPASMSFWNPSTKILAYLGLLMIIIPWIVVGLIDAMTAFSTASRMNDGEILYKKNAGVGFWFYIFVITLLTLLYFFFLCIFSIPHP
jgi:hypothetical protein